MTTDRPYITIGAVVARLHDAGYGDTIGAVRAAIDRGVYGEQGIDWYRAESGYRMVRPAAVDRVVAGRRRRRAGAGDADSQSSPHARGSSA